MIIVFVTITLSNLRQGTTEQVNQGKQRKIKVPGKCHGNFYFHNVRELSLK
jgi:hypothetical protein